MKTPRLAPVISIAFVLALGNIALAQSQTQPPIGSTPALPSSAKDDASAVQHGAQPNPGEVRPGNAAGDSPSATPGTLVREENARRILGLPVDAAILIAAVIVGLAVIAGVVIPGARRRREARRGGTYGRK